MAEKLRFIDATSGTPDYDSAEHAITEEIKADGIAYNYLNMLEVVLGAGLEVVVKDGAMMSQGRTYIQDEPSDGASPKTIQIDAATSGYMRKDIIAVEYDIPNGVATAKVVKGAEAVSSPQLPTLLSGSTKWHKSLAVVNVTGGAITSLEDTRQVGSGRVNPAFTEDISAPNIKIESGGKFYLLKAATDATSAYLRYTSNALYVKLPNCVEVQIPGVVVGTSATAPAGTYPINTMYLEREV